MDAKGDGVTCHVNLRAAKKASYIFFAYHRPLESLCLCLAILSLLTGPASMAEAQIPVAAPTGQSKLTDYPTSFLTSQPTFAEPLVRGMRMVERPPTLEPTKSLMPSSQPTMKPTMTPQPSDFPASFPTSQPTFDEPMIRNMTYRQKFMLGNGSQFSEDEICFIERLYADYTTEFAQLPIEEVEMKITSTFIVHRFNLIEGSQFGNMDFTMRYESRSYNVSFSPKLFQSWINQNLELVKDQMQEMNINVTDVRMAQRLLVLMHEPTESGMPSCQPTMKPTMTSQPSVVASGPPVVASGAPVRTIPPTAPLVSLMSAIIFWWWN